ncbi:hypothetical protein B566_EDAN002547 [Ephemera danica]|nr:hypothetical protein B566_EDAN002547 [Ephemera danica]
MTIKTTVKMSRVTTKVKFKERPHSRSLYREWGAEETSLCNIARDQFSELMAGNEMAGAPDLVPRCSHSLSRRNHVAVTGTISNLPSRTHVTLEFNNLTYTVKDNRTQECKPLLKCLSGRFAPGELNAVMGPSGAGKSTLLNVLAGYKTCRDGAGEVLVNGAPRDARRFRKLSCYIMQDSELLPHLTVFEAMHAAACLKLGNTVTQEERQVVVQEVLVALSMVECSNTLTSKLSGGQRKRLSIAQELVSNPPVMFFDEPTSGLDSTSCYHCIALLKTLAQGGRMIVCSIHQPSARIFEMFDQLYMLAEGQCIYRGSIPGLLPFLSASGLECPTYHNPADFAMEVASGEHGDVVTQLVQAVSSSNYSTQLPSSKNNQISNHFTKEKKQTNGCLETPEMLLSILPGPDISSDINGGKRTFSSSGWTQFVVLLKRTMLCIIRDPTLTKLRVAAHVGVGLLIGMLYFDIGNDASRVFNNGGFLMVCTLFLMFCAMMPTILTFPLEKAVFNREHLNSWYSLKPFYFAKTIADVPFLIVYSVSYLTIVYFMTSQPTELYRYAMFVLSGIILGPVISLPMTMFAGFFVSFSTIPDYLRWMSYLSYLRYSFEGFAVTIYGNDRARLDCHEIYCHFRSPSKFLEEIEMADSNVWVCIGALLASFIVLRALTFVVLWLKLRFRQ